MAVRRELPVSENQLLDALATRYPKVYEELEPTLERVSLPRGTVLGRAGEYPAAAYFIDSGVVSVISNTTSGESLEVAFVGTEGVTAVSWLLSGAPAPYSFITQLPVTARRLRATSVRPLTHGPHPLWCLILLYADFAVAQLAQSALCARFHTAAERLSRWLLLTALKSRSDILPLTHEFVSQMVGAPRSLVTEAAGTLRAAGIIAYRRGTIVITDRRRLERRACECFAQLRSGLRTYERAIRSASRAGSQSAS